MDISLEDLDFDFDSANLLADPAETTADNSNEVIKDYLRGKISDFKRLSEISEKNLSAIRKQQNLCLEYLKETEQFDSVYVSVVKVWRKIHNEQWIVGICLKNTAERLAENVNIILTSNSKQDLHYSAKLYSKFKENIPEELKRLQTNGNTDLKQLLENIEDTFEKTPKWIPVENLQKETTVIVTLNIPKFIDYSEFELNGILSYEMSARKYQLKLPKINLLVEDILKDKLTLTLNNTIQGSEEDILSILSTSQITVIQIILPDGLYRTLEGILQLDCSFSKTNEEAMFIFDGKSQSLRFVMLRIGPDKKHVELITKSEDQLHLLYHHFYKNIPNVVLLNEDCEKIADSFAFLTRPTQIFLDPFKQDQNVLKDFIDSFDKQLIFIEDKIKNVNENIVPDDSNSLTLCETVNDYKLFRFKLNELEKQSNELFLKAFDKKV